MFKIFEHLLYTLACLPVVKHMISETFIAFNFLMAEFVCSEHMKGGNYYKKKMVTGHGIYLGSAVAQW